MSKIRGASGALWLLIVGAGLLVAGYFVFPRADLPIRPRPVQVVIASPLRLTTATLDITPIDLEHSSIATRDWLLTLTLGGYQNPHLPNDSAEVTLYFPDQPQLSFECPEDCMKPDYSSVGADNSSDYQGVMTSFNLQTDPDIDQKRYRVGSIAIEVRGTNGLPSINCTASECRGSVPRIFGIQMFTEDEEARYPDGYSDVKVVAQGLADYRWDAASLDPPMSTLHMSTALDYSSVHPNYASQQVDGTNTVAAKSESDRTFWSGLLAGLAGGALLASAQVQLTPKRLTGKSPDARYP